MAHETPEPATEAAADHANEHGLHPLGVYFKIWILLFVLSACSYYVDWAGFEGFTRWTLIVIFMFLKAGFIVAVFMHMMWERMLLILAILAPPLLLIGLVGIMVLESEYTFWTRVIFFGLFEG
jgi:cytochrome c oxidase subunit 4